MELGPEPPHRRRLLFACGSPPPAPPAPQQPVVKALFGAPQGAPAGLSPVASLALTMGRLQGLDR